MEKEDLKLLQEKVTLLRAEGKYKETIETSYNLLKRATEINDYKSILIANLNNAASFYCIGDIEEAFHSIEAYDDVCRKYGDDADQLNLYNVLFLLFEYNKDFHKAKETLEKSIDLGIKLKKYNIVSNGYSNYSHIYIAEENYADALEMGKVGLQMAKLHQPARPILELRVSLNIALAYIGLNDLVASGSLLNEMINNPILGSFIREKAECYSLQGKWYSKQKLYREAFDSLTCAKELVETYNDVYLLKTIQDERCKLCELMNDIHLGYMVQKEYISLLNEVSNRELALTALKLDVKHSITEIEKEANTDYLTGLYNRKYLETKTNEWLKQSSLENESLVCIVFDIDYFKAINDDYGHLFGDGVIKQVGKAASKIIREDDLISRYGGDEFVVILRRVSLEDGKKKALQIEAALRNLKFDEEGSNLSIKASIGVADNANGTIVDFNELFRIADSRLYKAKRNGKNQIWFC